MSNGYVRRVTQREFWAAIPPEKEEEVTALFRALEKTFDTFDENVIRHAVLTALQAPAPDHEIRNLFSNPLRLARRLAELQQSFETVLAGLVYASVKPDSPTPQKAHERLMHIQEAYGPAIAHIVRQAIDLAHMHRPAIGEKFEKKMRQDDVRVMEERKKAFGLRRKRKPRRIKPSLREEQNALYLLYLQQKDFDPRAAAIRTAERDIVIEDIDPDRPGTMDRLRLEESIEVQGPLALGINLYHVYERINDKYLKTMQPEIYHSIGRVMDRLRSALGPDFLMTMEADIEAKLSTAGLVRATRKEDIEAQDEGDEKGKPDYYLAGRYKSRSSLHRKLLGDGIDPVLILQQQGIDIKNDPDGCDRVLLDYVIRHNVFDLFGLRLIANEQRMIDKGVLKAPRQSKHGARDACDRLGGLLMNGVPDIASEDTPGVVVYDARRIKDYNRNPKGNGYTSLQIGFAVHADIPALGLKRFPIYSEVQIRTVAMDRSAEYGAAAHWRHKKGVNLGPGFGSAAGEVGVRTEEPRHLFAFTEQGQIFHIASAVGAPPPTVADMAFLISAALGARCAGATVRKGYISWHPVYNPWPEGKELSGVADFLLPQDPLPNGCTVTIIKDNGPLSRARLERLRECCTTTHAQAMLEKQMGQLPAPRALKTYDL